MENLTVVDNPAESQFEARAGDGGVVGFIAYDAGAAGPGVVVLTHTQVDPAHEGKGVGGELARGALDLIRASGQQIVPLCPFVAAYLRRHPEYADLVRPTP